MKKKQKEDHIVILRKEKNIKLLLFQILQKFNFKQTQILL